jgi:hypothetical protein
MEEPVLEPSRPDPLYVYRLSPIDFWPGWTLAKNAVRAVDFGPSLDYVDHIDGISPEE